MRLARLHLGSTYLLNWIREGQRIPSVCLEGILPADAEIVDAKVHDRFSNVLVLTLASKRFRDLADGEPIPTLPDPVHRAMP